MLLCEMKYKLHYFSLKNPKVKGGVSPPFYINIYQIPLVSITNPVLIAQLLNSL
uniref:Uncharacterized protein n=1 Tax=Vibrio parahaemolyticus TaxID=670 RepID=A0A7M1WJ98_VIBPH|nr:hypothetical protein VP353_00030 [Vibrio parahaemolyticus]QOS20122.1 hypothetical protein VP42_00030 [Vibrio parahaemolyticus]QOS24587.1 hypothetical protein VP51_00030 [Vibrio parahaemolyticus]QOS26818.1 hypothetical protein VP231_00030 [Vibrio parahaemolyticus]QOS27244.1 hypothetical protein VP43_00030 [Vibrio parahaemolyticus]